MPKFGSSRLEGGIGQTHEHMKKPAQLPGEPRMMAGRFSPMGWFSGRERATEQHLPGSSERPQAQDGSRISQDRNRLAAIRPRFPRSERTRIEEFVTRFYPSEAMRASAEHQAALESLQIDVERAALYAPREQLTADKRTLVADLERRQAEVKLFTSLPPGSTIKGEGNPPYCAMVSEPELFDDLIRLGIREVARSHRIPDQLVAVEAMTQDELGHEIAHVRKALKYPQITMAYGIRFYRDAKNGRLGFYTFTELSGNATLAQFQEILGAPKDPGGTDRAGAGIYTTHNPLLRYIRRLRS